MNSISPQETDYLQIYNIFVIYNFFNQKIAKYLNNQMTENLEYRFAKEYFTSLAERCMWSKMSMLNDLFIRMRLKRKIHWIVASINVKHNYIKVSRVNSRFFAYRWNVK